MIIKRKYRSSLQLLVFFLCFLTVVYYFVDRDEKSLLTNKSLTVGIVEKMERFPRDRDIRIWYSYNVGNIQFTNQYHLYVDNKYRRRLEELLKDNRLVVVYDTTKFENCDLLLLKRDFRRYNLQRPENLSDVFQVIDGLAKGSE